MRLIRILPFITAFPAVFFGCAAMYVNGISPYLYGQNLLCFLILGIIVWYRAGREKCKIICDARGFLILGILFLLLTFFSTDIEVVYRWIKLGPVTLYISSIIMPVMLIGMWRLLQHGQWWVTYSVSLIVVSLLAMQPDASQLTGFSVPAMILLCVRAERSKVKYCCTFLMIVFIVNVWLHIDHLPPVEYVENILGMVCHMGPMWAAGGICSLLILPLPFFFGLWNEYKTISICLGIYFALILVSTRFGNFPVPLMGYGISPIFGYLAACDWKIHSVLLKEDKKPSSV